MLAADDLKFDSEKRIFLGELGLDGTLRRIRGALPLVMEAKRAGYEEIYLPKENAIEAALVEGIKIFGANSLKEVVEHINETEGKRENKKPARPDGFGRSGRIPIQPKTEISYKKERKNLDFSDVRGQEGAKRGLEIAAAGGHNIAMYGPPGTGKTMLAKALSGILPPLSFDEILEVTEIHSMSGFLNDILVFERPFRSPHHTASHVAIIGGGSNIKPGEVTLAHKGVLFLIVGLERGVYAV